MKKYELTDEEITKISSDFNNTNIGRKIWLYSKAPHIICITGLVIYLGLIITGIINPEIKDTIAAFIFADLIVLGVSLIGIGITEILYWKEIINYINSKEEEEKEKAKLVEKKTKTKKVTSKKETKKQTKGK